MDGLKGDKERNAQSARSLPCNEAIHGILFAAKNALVRIGKYTFEGIIQEIKPILPVSKKKYLNLSVHVLIFKVLLTVLHNIRSNDVDFCFLGRICHRYIPISFLPDR